MLLTILYAPLIAGDESLGRSFLFPTNQRIEKLETLQTAALDW